MLPPLFLVLSHPSDPFHKHRPSVRAPRVGDSPTLREQPKPIEPIHLYERGQSPTAAMRTGGALAVTTIDSACTDFPLVVLETLIMRAYYLKSFQISGQCTQRCTEGSERPFGGRCPIRLSTRRIKGAHGLTVASSKSSELTFLLVIIAVGVVALTRMVSQPHFPQLSK